MYGFSDFEELDEFEPPAERGASRKNHRRQKALNPQHKPKKSAAEVFASLVDNEEDSQDFIQTYQASRHERVWIAESLGYFYHQRWITDILRKVKGGKEASVYLCQGHASAPAAHLAAKVYRPRQFRNLRKDHLYREGREELNAEGNIERNKGALHAMHKKTGWGQDLLHSSWIAYEVKALQALGAAGADVPAFYGRSNNALLMDYIGDPEFPAPLLNEVTLSMNEAQRLFARVVQNIEVMLAHDIIHADLSAYNILYWQGEIWLIDFPQAVSPRINRSAYQIFSRDVTRVCEYFTRMGMRLNAAKLARDLWVGRGLHVKPEVHPALLNDEDEGDYKYWQKYQDEE
jgi:RIO kinase 1